MKNNLLFTRNPKTPFTSNDCVKQGYAQILKQTKVLLSTLEDSSLRHIRIKRIRHPFEEYPIIENELISPLVYLQLGWYYDHYRIYFGFNIDQSDSSCHEITSAFLRIIYKSTMKGSTAYNIEKCIYTDCLLTDCETFYEYNNHREKDKYLTRILKYRPKTVKRKLQRVA
jgi:hypothetical protein